MSTSQRVVKNTAFLYIRTIVSLFVSVFTTRILLQGLGASDYGLYNVVGGAIAMLGFLSSSMSSTTQRFLSFAEGAGEEEKSKKYFNNAILIHNGLALLMLAIFAIAALFFFNGVLNIPEGKLSTAIVIYICMLISTVFSITIAPYDAEINAHENMLFYSLTGILDVLFKFAIAIAVLYFPSDKLIFYAILMAVESFVLRLICQIYCRIHYKECRHVNLRANYDKQIIREMTSFAGWNLVNVATGMLSLYGMNIVVNHYFGTTVNAAMGIATQLSGVMMGVSMNMIKAISPVLVKSEGGNQHQRMLDISYVGCKFSYLLFAFFGIPVLIFMSKVLSVWLAEVPKWTESFGVLLIIATLLEQFTVVLYQSILAGGNIKNYNIARAVTNILPLFLSIGMFEFTDLEPPWVFVNWMIFKSLCGSLVDVVYAKTTIGLKPMQFIDKILAPSALSSGIVVILGLCLWYICTCCQINELVGLALTILAVIPVFWVIALNGKERTIFKNIISELIHKCI